jgi:predicted acylesterase/phospholipase RssA
MIDDFNTLVLSGGGVKGLAMLGSLQYFIHDSKLKNLRKYIGTSIGAIICVLLIIGYDPKDIIVRFIHHQYLPNLPGYDFYNGIQGKGFLSYEVFEKILVDVIENKLGKIPTFGELYDLFGKELYIVTFNYTQKEEVILSHETSSSMSILTGLRMSSNVPFVFENFNYQGDFYFDGFITNNFPINLVNFETDIVIGINALQETWIQDEGLQLLSGWKIFWNLFILPFYEIQILRNKAYEKKCKVINIPLQDFSFLNFRLSSREILDLYSIGYRSMKTT